MEPAEALSTAAQIAVALAGFAGVVVSFRSRSLHEWPLIDKYRLWLLMGSALVPLFTCLFGMLLLTIRPTPISIWRLGSAFSLVSIAAFGFLSRRRQLELGSAFLKEMGSYRYLFYGVAILGSVVAILQAYNVLRAGVFWLFFSAIVFQLAIGTLQFARMILLPPHLDKKAE